MGLHWAPYAEVYVERKSQMGIIIGKEGKVGRAPWHLDPHLKALGFSSGSST